MSRRYLFGPVSAAFARDNLAPQREQGTCLTFGAAPGADVLLEPGGDWESLCRKLPEG